MPMSVNHTYNCHILFGICSSYTEEQTLALIKRALACYLLDLKTWVSAEKYWRGRSQELFSARSHES